MDLLIFDLFKFLAIALIVAGILMSLSILLPGLLAGPYVPSELDDAQSMLRMARVQPGDLVVDLGAGDGRLLFLAAREFGARALGVEISPTRAALIWLKIQVFGLQGQVQVRLGDLYNTDLHRADVVTFYLLPGVVRKLQDKLAAELPPAPASSRTATHWIGRSLNERDFYTYIKFLDTESLGERRTNQRFCQSAKLKGRLLF